MTEWLESYLKSKGRKRLSQKTIKLYRDVLKNINLDLSKCSEKQLNNVLDRLASEPKENSDEERSDSYYRLNVILIKDALKFLDRKDLAEKIELPKIRDREGKVKEQILSDEDIKKLIEKAPTEQDRLLIYMLFESGARPNELYNLRIKDVQFDQNSAILWLTGKTGTRKRRVYMTVSELKEHIAKHPERDNDSARFFRYGHGGSSDFHDRTISNRIRRLGKEILGKQINPRMFRHTRATKDCQDFSTPDLMILYGWKTPIMPTVYTHLTQSDVDEKDLRLHGKKIKKKDVLKPLMQIQVCSKCKAENAPYAVYCHKCSQVLVSRDMDETQKEIRQLRARVEEMDLIGSYPINMPEETLELSDEAFMNHVKENPHYKSLLELNPERAEISLHRITGLAAGLRETVSKSLITEEYKSEIDKLKNSKFEKYYGFKPKPRFDSLNTKDRIVFIKKCPELDDEDRKFVLRGLGLAK